MFLAAEGDVVGLVDVGGALVLRRRLGDDLVVRLFATAFGVVDLGVHHGSRQGHALADLGVEGYVAARVGSVLARNGGRGCRARGTRRLRAGTPRQCEYGATGHDEPGEQVPDPGYGRASGHDNSSIDIDRMSGWGENS